LISLTLTFSSETVTTRDHYFTVMAELLAKLGYTKRPKKVRESRRVGEPTVWYWDLNDQELDALCQHYDPFAEETEISGGIEEGI